MMGEILFSGIAGDERVEMSQFAPDLGRKIRPKRCASSCREPNVPET